MLYIANESQDPHFNLALEEYVLKNFQFDDRCILLWQNNPSVIIGRFQNTVEEVNVDYVKSNNIYVVRRLSGGGAVYHDSGNLNFTFIEKSDSSGIDFSKYTKPIVEALAQIGINAELSGRNDITIDGKKFSGNAQYQYKGRTLHHGTLLFDSNLANVQAALNVKADKYESKGIKSVRSRVTNIIDYLNEKITIDEFKDVLLQCLFAGKPIKEYQLSAEDITAVQELMAEKYLTWEWNYGSSPAFNMQRTGRFKCGGIDLRLRIEKGLIEACKIYGDFFSNEDISEFEDMLVGVRYDEGVIGSLLEKIDLSRYFGPLEKEDLLKCLF